MARQKRLVSETGIYHVLLRGVNSLFLTGADFETFLSILKQKSGDAKVIAYALLKNRIHIIIDTKGADIGLILKPIATSYARYCNRTRATSGKLFYDRFKSEAVSSKSELLSAVAFVNFIAISQKENEFSSYFMPLCKPSECGITAKQAQSCTLSQLFIEDYDCLSKAELAEYIFAFCGVYPKEFKSLSPERQREVSDKLADSGKFSRSKLYEIFGIKKPQSAKKPVPKKAAEPAAETAAPTAQKQKKKDLSVWLL